MGVRGTIEDQSVGPTAQLLNGVDESPFVIAL
jgi:hypothetical protein